MQQIISIHSFRGGTGKSNIVANLAALLAAEGKRVGVIDTDIQSPGIHVLFGLDENTVNYALNDYLWGKCDIGQAAHDVTLQGETAMAGNIFLIPSSLQSGEISRVLREGYAVSRLNDGYHELMANLSLDILLIDTHPGLNEETLLSIVISDILVVILRPDQQDYQGTGVTVDVAHKLDVPHLTLIVNNFDITQGDIAIMHAVPASGPKRCIQCHQADSEIDIGVLHIQHPASSFNAEAPKWTLSQQQYCNACYRRAEQDQHQRELAKLWMALLPMGWMVFSGAFIYSCLYPNPGVAPLEAHLFFFGTSLAAFYAIPATIYRRFKLSPLQTP